MNFGIFFYFFFYFILNYQRQILKLPQVTIANRYNVQKYCNYITQYSKIIEGDFDTVFARGVTCTYDA